MVERGAQQGGARADAFHRTLAANLPDVATFLLDRDLRILLAEGEVLRRPPFSVNAAYVGSRIEDLYGELPSELLDQVLEHYRKALSGERRQFTIRQDDVTFSVVAAPITEAVAGDDAAIVVVARDVTRYERTASEIKRSQVLQRTLSGNIPDTSVGLLDGDLRWVVVEGEDALERLGISRDRLLGRVLGDTHQTLARLVRPHALRALEGVRGSVEWSSPAGHTFLLNVAPAPGLGGPHAVVSLTDVTERRAVEARVQSLDARFRSAFDHAPIGMMLVDFGDPVPGCIIRVNDALAGLLGYEHKDLTGRTIVEVAHPDDRPGVEEHIRQVRAGLRGGTEVERRYLAADGEAIPVALTASVLPDDEGHLLGLAHIQDLRQVKRAEAARRSAEDEHQRLQEALHQFQKLETVGRLAGGVAHDFNNLLAVIMHSASFARAELGDHPAARELTEIETAAQRAADLTRQLLMLGRRESARPQRVDLAAVVDALQPQLREAAGEQVMIQAEMGAQAIVLADPAQIERALLNLAANAGEAMPGGGRLHIGARRLDGEEAQVRGRASGAGYLELTVRDTGRGMPEAVREHAVDPFFTTKPTGAGTGLGLTTAYGIAIQNGGDLEIESREGEGTTVRLLLPLAEPELALAPATGEAAERAPAPGRRVLVVEDEPGLRRIAERILLAGGYEVTVVADAREAMGAAADADVVLTDVVMPGLSGTDLADHLSQRFPHLPVIFMSGYTDRPGRLPAGALFLGKPFTREDLLGAVGEALSGSG